MGRNPVAVDVRHMTRLNNYAWKTIKRFSQAKEKKQIHQYMNDHFTVDETFALGIRRMQKSPTPILPNNEITPMQLLLFGRT
jgi:hypothetical protein